MSGTSEISSDYISDEVPLLCRLIFFCIIIDRFINNRDHVVFELFIIYFYIHRLFVYTSLEITVFFLFL